MTDNTLKARLERCKALQEPEQVVGVKEGYVVQCRGDYGLTDATLAEALTLRTAEDVRREAFKQAMRVADKQIKKKEQSIRRETLEEVQEAIGNASCGKVHVEGMSLVKQLVCSLIDNPAPKQDTRALQAEAWDEGHRNYLSGQNPYRKGDE